MGRTTWSRNENMDQVERLLGLYKGAQTEAEKHILLETVRISSPGDFPRLEDRILQDQVRGMPFEQLVQMIASHRRITPQQAGELLRDAVWKTCSTEPGSRFRNLHRQGVRPGVRAGSWQGRSLAPVSPPAVPAPAGTARRRVSERCLTGQGGRGHHHPGPRRHSRVSSAATAGPAVSAMSPCEQRSEMVSTANSMRRL